MSQAQFILAKAWGYVTGASSGEEIGTWCRTRSVFVYGDKGDVKAPSGKSSMPGRGGYPDGPSVAKTQWKSFLQTHKIPYSQTKTIQTNKYKQNTSLVPSSTFWLLNQSQVQ